MCAILRADLSVSRLRFGLDNVLSEDSKLLDRTRNQVRLFRKNIESVEDLRYKRLVGVIRVGPVYRNVAFVKRCLEVPNSDSSDPDGEGPPDAIRALSQVVNPHGYLVSECLPGHSRVAS